MNQSSKANEAQLVCDQDGTVLVKQYDWTKFLGQMKKIKGIKKQHQFYFSSDKPGTPIYTVNCKLFCFFVLDYLRQSTNIRKIQIRK